MSCICIDTSALQRIEQWRLLDALHDFSLDASDAAARDGASTNPRPGAGCATNRRWWGGRGSEMEDATSPWTQPIAPSQELGLLKYGGPDQMTGKTLSPLGEGRIAEGSKLRVPLGEEGLRGQQEGNVGNWCCWLRLRRARPLPGQLFHRLVVVYVADSS